jgi:tRNA modification GTPase
MTEFVHRPYQNGATIAAIATPPGEGGVAIIRISGNEAIAIAEKIYIGAAGPVRSFRSHTAHLGKIFDRNQVFVDEVLLLVMRAPHSYTGEETVEIHCHGGMLVSRKVLEAALQAGARGAEPGEFTFKAFINGKLDLAQAEAVQELIAAKSDLALQAAEKQLQGGLSKKIHSFQQRLIEIAAILEAWVDFPEEDLAFAPMEEVIGQLQDIQTEMQRLEHTFHEGKMLSAGVSLCLVGPPNAGKSSLMNALLGKDRAIVTDIPGTTRDLLEEDMRLGKLHVRLIDTAGIRETEEIVEKEGVRRSKCAMGEADLVLCVLDSSLPLCNESHALLSCVSKDNAILVWNKIDLQIQAHLSADFIHIARVSAKTGEGLDELKETIHRAVSHTHMRSKEEVILTSSRHCQAIHQAVQVLECVIAGLKTGISPEFVSSDMRALLLELGTILGTNISEDILNAIFSKFCIGK